MEVRREIGDVIWGVNGGLKGEWEWVCGSRCEWRCEGRVGVWMEV